MTSRRLIAVNIVSQTCSYVYIDENMTISDYDSKWIVQGLSVSTQYFVRYFSTSSALLEDTLFKEWGQAKYTTWRNQLDTLPTQVANYLRML